MTIAEENAQALAALSRVESTVQGMDVQTLGTVLVRSGYFKDTSQLSQAIVKVLAGQEVGFGPIASMQNIFLVQGKVSYGSGLIAAAIQKSGRYRYRVTKIDREGCTIKFFERAGDKWDELGVSSFGPEDAHQAGLKSQTYAQYPRNMYFARALTNGARWYCPDVFSGSVYTPDELGAVVDDDGAVINVPAAPPMDTAEVKQLSDQYVQIFGEQGDVSERAKALLMQNAELLQQAADLRVPGLRQLTAQKEWSESRLETTNAELSERIREHNADLDQQAAKQAGQAQF